MDELLARQRLGAETAQRSWNGRIHHASTLDIAVNLKSHYEFTG
jgi:hypothetical protein